MAFDEERMQRDPDYAPGQVKLRGKYLWRPPKKYVGLGYPSKSKPLPGAVGDHRGRERAKLCREYVRGMLAALGADTGAEPGTWAWVIERWKFDPISKYGKTKNQNTRDDYDWRCGKWLTIVGHMRIEDLDYEQLGTILTAMDAKGRSASFKSKLMVMLRMLARYAKGPLKQKQARDVQDLLDDVRMEMPAKRSVFPTGEQIRKIIDEADARGLHGYALGILIQWTYALRAVDVRGQWFPAKAETSGGIVLNGKAWQDGLTWDMVAPDLSTFSKVPSKTRRSLPEALVFDTTPEVRSRLRLMRNQGGVGPVIISERTGLPYTPSGWTQAWARLRTATKLPKEIWMMDTRAGAITDGREKGAGPLELRDMAAHKHVSTTDGYIRGRSETAGKVVRLRFGG